MNPFITTLAFLFGIFLPIILSVLVKNFEIKKFESLPSQQIPANVIQKEIRAVRCNGKSAATRDVYFITFELPKSENLAFIVDSKVFCSLSEGMDGLLTFKQSDKQNYFISFEKSGA